MTDEATLKRCHEKVSKVLTELTMMETRFLAYCEFYKASIGIHKEWEKMQEVYKETLRPMQDIYIIYSLLDEFEREQMPALDKESLSDRRQRIEHSYWEASAAHTHVFE
ncbi:hypothetical protein [Planococcus sp. ISL-110]|uniref:hypothetical protein n=1 Tax=Planococcus sp. ISL-110 TaxID=2819167 RepID=UPI001BECEB65|nr:hypothetical protein [Planococcus sp. ISL-110]MBT2569846.1 hypothetical protein [Planococcus sp. ISL-110]